MQRTAFSILLFVLLSLPVLGSKIIIENRLPTTINGSSICTATNGLCGAGFDQDLNTYDNVTFQDLNLSHGILLPDGAVGDYSQGVCFGAGNCFMNPSTNTIYSYIGGVWKFRISKDTLNAISGNGYYMRHGSTSTLAPQYSSRLDANTGLHIQTGTETGELVSNGKWKLRYNETAVDVNSSFVVRGNTTLNTPYAAGYIHNHTGRPFSIASSGVLYNITGWNITHANQFTGDAANGEIEVLVPGTYKLDYSISFSGGANDEYEVAFLVNGREDYGCGILRKLGSSGDVGNAGGVCLTDLDKGDIVTLAICNHDSAADANIHTMSSVVRLMGG